EALFRDKKIEDYFLQRKGATRTGIKLFDPICQQTTDINFSGNAVSLSDRKKLFTQINELATRKPSWFVLSGSVPPGCDVKIYRDLIPCLKKSGSKVLLDAS